MKVSLIALACTALLGATSAMADGRHGDNGHGDRDRHGYDHGNGHGRDGWRDGRDYRHESHDGHHGYDRGRHNGDRYDHRWNNGPRYGYGGHGGGWHRGGYYRNGGYIVRDYGSYHLRHPGYGYHWIRDGRDYLLVAIATGLIADVVINGYDY